MARRSRDNTPAGARLYRGEVLRTVQLSPHWQRVTLTGVDIAKFPWQGADHWFRLFVPRDGQAGLELPELGGKEWWHPYLALPDEVRPHCANYTVAGYRPGDQDRRDAELDVDFVLHRDQNGNLEGEAAVWACRTTPGDPAAILDQGTIFDPPDDAADYILVSDETGVPGVRNILRGLSRAATGRAVLEVPTATDQTSLGAPEGFDVVWIDRSRTPGARPGTAALAELDTWTDVAPGAYGYVVGESALATGGRRRLHTLGLPKHRISFSGYWRRDPDQADPAT